MVKPEVRPVVVEDDGLIALGKTHDGYVRKTQVVQDLTRHIHLPLASVDHQQTRFLQVLVDHAAVAAVDGFTDGSEVIDGPVQRFDVESSVSCGIRVTVYK